MFFIVEGFAGQDRKSENSQKRVGKGIWSFEFKRAFPSNSFWDREKPMKGKLNQVNLYVWF